MIDPEKEEHIEENIKKSIKWIIFPTDTFKLLWDFWIGLLLLYTITLVPFMISFFYNSNYDLDTYSIIDNLVDVSFAADIILTFFCAYYESEGNQEILIYDKKKIFYNYVNNGLTIDFLAVF